MCGHAKLYIKTSDLLWKIEDIWILEEIQECIYILKEGIIKTKEKERKIDFIFF